MSSSCFARVAYRRSRCWRWYRSVLPDAARTCPRALRRIDSSPQQSNHFGWQRDTTGSVAAAPAAPVERRDLPQYTRPQYQSQPIAAADLDAKVLSGGVRRIGRRAALVRMRLPRVRSNPPVLSEHGTAGITAAAPRSSSAPAIRWKVCRTAMVSPPPRSSRPTDTAGRAGCSLASNSSFQSTRPLRTPMSLRQPSPRLWQHLAFISSIAATR